jgi:glycosyltransferase EpsE
MPKVSILFPVYNEKSEYLKLALESIANQTFEDFEILILDDSSSEETVKVIDDFSKIDSRVVVFRRNDSKGLTSALNVGIEIAKGEYIVRADSDDIQTLYRLEKLLAYFSDHPEIEVLGSAISKINSSGVVTGIRLYPLNYEEIVKISCIRNPIAHPTVAIRKSTLLKYGGYDESFSSAEDYELWCRLISNQVKIANIKDPLVFYRLPNFTRRFESGNWKSCLRLKLKYFSSKHLILRTFGILTVLFYMVLPVKLRAIFYDIYNNQ